MNILISIKPKYAAQIYDGTKLYEIRKVLPKHFDWGDTIYFYESGTGVITGRAIVDVIVSGEPEYLYKKIQTGLGIGYDDYKKYVSNAKQVYYIGLADATKFNRPLTLHDFDLKRAPQSFCYLR